MRPAKWITASIGWPDAWASANSRSSRAASRTSPSTNCTGRPVSSATRSRATGELLAKLSSTTSSWPASSSTTQVWLPMKPAPPVISRRAMGSNAQVRIEEHPAGQGGALQGQGLAQLIELGAGGNAGGGDQQLGDAATGLAQIAAHEQLTAAKGTAQFRCEGLLADRRARHPRARGRRGHCRMRKPRALTPAGWRHHPKWPW